MTTTSLEAQVLGVIETCRGLIPAEQLDDMGELARAGEPGIALENLSTQLYEYDVSVETETIDQIKSLGETMGLDPKYWLMLAARVR